MIKYGKNSISKSGGRKIALLRVFAAAFLFASFCTGAAGCARKDQSAAFPVRDTDSPMSENPSASSDDADTPDGADTSGNSETPGNSETSDGSEDNSSSDTNPGGTTPDTSSDGEKNNDNPGETDHPDDTPSGDEDTPSDDDTETGERYAEYYADGTLIRRCTIAKYGNVVLDEPLVPEKDGYTGEWREVASKDKNVIRYEAQYTVIVYTITYILQRGKLPDGMSNPQEYTVEMQTFDLCQPELRKGYRFCGWYTEKDPYINKIERIERGSTGNITVYAKWEKTA